MSSSGANLGRLIQDRLGSVAYNAGTATRMRYYPWGEEYTTTTQNQEKFGTYYRDKTTGLDYAQNRYYSSTLGRFLTADPYRSASATDPGTWNRYAYVNGDPINFTDPSGLSPQEGGPPTSGCYFNDIWIPGCDIGRKLGKLGEARDGRDRPETLRQPAAVPY